MSALRTMGVSLVAAGMIGLTFLSTAPPVAGQPQAKGPDHPTSPQDVSFPVYPNSPTEAQWVWKVQGNAAELAKQYVKAEGEEKKHEVRAKLTTLLGEQFDAHAKQQQKELEDLEKQITRLRTLLRKRQDARATIIERRIDQLVQEAEGLGWSAPATPHAVYFPNNQAEKR